LLTKYLFHRKVRNTLSQSPSHRRKNVDFSYSQEANQFRKGFAHIPTEQLTVGVLELVAKRST